MSNDSEHDKCYKCGVSLVENYNDEVSIIQDKSGVHFVCKACALKIREKQKPSKKVA